jgi:hypothetical protein
VIEGLQQGAKRLAARSAELEKLADAAKPLYESLDDAQKGRFCTSPAENIGITNTKAFVTARIPMGQPH